MPPRKPKETGLSIFIAERRKEQKEQSEQQGQTGALDTSEQELVQEYEKLEETAQIRYEHKAVALNDQRERARLRKKRIAESVKEEPMPEEIVQEGIGTDAKAPKLNEEAVRKHSVTANVHDRQVVDVNGQEAVRCGDVLFRVIPASFGK